MPAGIKFDSRKLIGPIELSIPEVKGHMLAVLQNFGLKIKKDFEATTKTWKDHHPVFTKDFKFAEGYIKLTVTTNDQVWTWLNDGTDRRWALMSHDFMPKTAKRQFTSYAGSGSVLYRGPAEMRAAGINWAQPGIEAREWTKAVIDLYAPEIYRALQEGVRKGMASAMRKGR